MQNTGQPSESVYRENHNQAPRHRPPPESSFSNHNNTGPQGWQENSQAAANMVQGAVSRTTRSTPRFVCDTMLAGLARQLRRCGVDCVFFEHDRGGDQSFRSAVDERRILLTRNGNFERVCIYAKRINKFCQLKFDDGFDFRYSSNSTYHLVVVSMLWSTNKRINFLKLSITLKSVSLKVTFSVDANCAIPMSLFFSQRTQCFSLCNGQQQYNTEHIKLQKLCRISYNIDNGIV